MSDDLPFIVSTRSKTNRPVELSLAQAAVQTVNIRMEEVRLRIADWSESGADREETVHRLRVASRRAVAGFEFFRKVVDRTFRHRAVELLKKLRSRLGRLRDWDVMAERFEHDSSKGAKCISKMIRRRRDRMIPATTKYVTDIGANLIALCADLPSIPPAASATEAASEPFKPWACDAVDRIARSFVESLRDVGRSAESLHRLRIAAKKLRYSLEILVLVVPETLDSPAYQRLQKLQSLLGEIQDGLVQQARLRKLSRKSNRKSVARFVDEEIHQRRRKHREFLSELDRLCSPYERTVLADAFAALLSSKV